MKKTKRGRPTNAERLKKLMQTSAVFERVLEPAPSKLDVLMSNLENEINRAITKLKEMV